MTKHFTSRPAHGDQVCTNRGDDRGTIGFMRGDGARVMGAVHRLPTRNGETWMSARPIRADKGFEFQTDFLGVLALDLDPTGSGATDLHAVLR